MARELEEMPLFPLHAVVFPYATIQLHVFEDRYREMMKRCLEFDVPFGIVLIRSGSEVGENPDPYMVGTAVRIMDVHEFEDGRMDVRVLGERRFRIRKFDESHTYLTGLVEPVIEIETEDSSRTLQLMSEAKDRFQSLIEGVFANLDSNVQINFPSDPTVLSFVIANLVNIDNLVKQQLLELTITDERLEELIPLIEKQIVESSTKRYYRLTAQHLEPWINRN